MRRKRSGLCSGLQLVNKIQQLRPRGCSEESVETPREPGKRRTRAGSCDNSKTFATGSQGFNLRTGMCTIAEAQARFLLQGRTQEDSSNNSLERSNQEVLSSQWSRQSKESARYSLKSPQMILSEKSKDALETLSWQS